MLVVAKGNLYEFADERKKAGKEQNKRKIFFDSAKPCHSFVKFFFKHAKRSEEDCKTLYIINLLEYSKISSHL